MATKDNHSDLPTGDVIASVGTQPTVVETLEVSPPNQPNKPQKKTEYASRSPFQESLQQLWHNKRAMVGLGIILFFILIAIIGPPIYTNIGDPIPKRGGGELLPVDYHGPFYRDSQHRNETPSALHWLGTDNGGRDLLARIMQSLLVSIGVALLVEFVNIVLGVLIGVLAGYYGGWIDQFLARFTDLMFAFPGLLFAILLTGIFGLQADSFFSNIPIIGQNGNARLLLVSIALAFTSWPLMARYVRGQTLQIKQQQFIEAAKTVGTPEWKIILRHIVPNLFSIVIIASTLNISGTIIGESGISALGLGVQSPGASLGVMIADGVASINTPNNWQILLPCLVLVIIVIAFSFLGDGLRDAFDPRNKD